MAKIQGKSVVKFLLKVVMLTSISAVTSIIIFPGYIQKEDSSLPFKYSDLKILAQLIRQFVTAGRKMSFPSSQGECLEENDPGRAAGLAVFMTSHFCDGSFRFCTVNFERSMGRWRIGHVVT